MRILENLQYEEKIKISIFFTLEYRRLPGDLIETYAVYKSKNSQPEQPVEKNASAKEWLKSGERYIEKRTREGWERERERERERGRDVSR